MTWEFALAILIGCTAGGLIGGAIIPLLPFNRAWTCDHYKSFWRGDMPFGGFP